MFRLYGPKKELFEKTWMLPDVEKVARDSGKATKTRRQGSTGEYPMITNAES